MSFHRPTALPGDGALNQRVFRHQGAATALAEAHGVTGSALRLSLRSVVEAGQASGVLLAQFLFREGHAVPSALQKVSHGSRSEPYLG